MLTGDLAEAVRNRSVYRQLHLNTAGAWKRCRGELSELVFSTAGPLPGYADMPWRQVTAAANSLAADGAEGLAVSIQGCLPTTYEEAGLREDMKQFAAEIEANGLEVGDVSIQVSDQVKAAQYFVTAVGRSDRKPEAGGLRPGQELVITRQIGLVGTAALARRYEEKLRGQFPLWLVDRAKSFDRFWPTAEVARIAYQSGADMVYSVAQGGIFNALWEMAEQAGTGVEADLRRIPVQQETIEVCEYFDLNPYYLYSAGCLLIGTEKAESLVAACSRARIPAVVIGRVTDGNDRVIWNGENRRFLDRPKRDELWKLGDIKEP